MKRVLLFILISFCSLNLIGQNYKEEDFQRLITLMFEKEVIQPSELLNVLEVDSCIYIGNVCDILHPDKVISLRVKGDQKIKVSSLKYIFFYDIKKWIKTYDCDISDTKAVLCLDIIIDNKIVRRGFIKFVKVNSKWKIQDKKIKSIDEDFSWLDESSK
jgi:hypothetical protein